MLNKAQCTSILCVNSKVNTITATVEHSLKQTITLTGVLSYLRRYLKAKWKLNTSETVFTMFAKCAFSHGINVRNKGKKQSIGGTVESSLLIKIVIEILRCSLGHVLWRWYHLQSIICKRQTFGQVQCYESNQSISSTAADRHFRRQRYIIHVLIHWQRKMMYATCWADEIENTLIAYTRNNVLTKEIQKNLHHIPNWCYSFIKMKCMK